MNDPSARERELIRDAFGHADGSPARPVPPVAAIVRRGRRARRTRSLVTASAAVLLIAACGSAAGVAASGTSSTPAPPAATGSPSPGAVSVPDRAFDSNHWQTGPAHPQVGVAYKFDLLVHCGIRYAQFDGHSWQTGRHVRVPEPTPNPSTGVTTWMPALAGYMTLVSADTARFEVASLPEAIVFHRMSRQAPLCA